MESNRVFKPILEVFKSILEVFKSILEVFIPILEVFTLIPDIFTLIPDILKLILGVRELIFAKIYRINIDFNNWVKRRYFVRKICVKKDIFGSVEKFVSKKQLCESYYSALKANDVLVLIYTYHFS